jgi:hypothetical protein
MASVIAAGITTTTSLVHTGDTSGVLQFQTNGTTAALTINNTQAIGIGTATPASPSGFAQNVTLYNATNAAYVVNANNAYRCEFAVSSNGGWLSTYDSIPLRFATSNTEVSRFDTNGNLGVGTQTPNLGGPNRAVTLNSLTSTNCSYELAVNNVLQGSLYTNVSTSSLNLGTFVNGPLTFITNSTERARIDSSGNLFINAQSSFNGSGCVLQATGTSANQVFAIKNSNANPFGLLTNYSAASPNGSGNEFVYCSDSTTLRASFRSNGGVANYSANNVNLSDRREKVNFAPAKSYLDVICSIPVQTYNYIDQNMENDGGLTLGVVAQDVQSVAPELVTESDWSVKKDGSKMRLSIYQTDMQYALMKCIQELSAKVTALEAKVA